MTYALAIIGAFTVAYTALKASQWWRRMKNCPSIFDRKQWVRR